MDLTDPTAPTTPSPSPTETAAPAATPTETAPPVPPYDKALQPVTVANGSGVPGRAQEIVQALVSGGFTQAGQFEATPVAQSVVYYGPGLRGRGCGRRRGARNPRRAGAAGPRRRGRPGLPGTDFTTGATYGASALPEDIVNQTAGTPSASRPTRC